MFVRHKPKLKDQSAEAARLFAEFGLATFCAQEVESALFSDMLYSLALAKQLHAVSDLDKTVAKYSVFTMGQIFKRLEPHLDDDQLGKMIKHALLTRNTLAHHFFRGKFLGLVSTEHEIAEAISVCHGAVKEFKALTARLEGRRDVMYSQLAANPDAFVVGLATRFDAAASGTVE